MVTLRRYSPEFVPLLFEAGLESAGEGFTEWMPWCHPDYTIEESQAYVLSRPDAWDRGEEYSFAIFAGDRFVGGTGINQISKVHGFGNLGYWIRRSEWGKGYAAAGALAAASFAFEELQLNRVEILVAVGNEKSRRAAEKMGSVHEGILRKRLVLAGRVCDAHMFSLV